MSFDNGNYFEEKNLTDADCDSKMEEVFVKPNNNTCTIINNGMVCYKTGTLQKFKTAKVSIY